MVHGTGVIRRIKLSQQPVNDGKEHLIPLCETLEAVFRNGLKSKEGPGGGREPPRGGEGRGKKR